jgi:hypothetical protein
MTGQSAALAEELVHTPQCRTADSSPSSGAAESSSPDRPEYAYELARALAAENGTVRDLLEAVAQELDGSPDAERALPPGSWPAPSASSIGCTRHEGASVAAAHQRLPHGEL